MNRQNPSRRRGSGKGVRARRMKTPPARLPAPSIARDDALLSLKYRELVRQHLDRLLDKLFTDVTGLHFHVAWAPAPDHEWESRVLPAGCPVCCRIDGSPLLADCRNCGTRQLVSALKADGEGHRFTCRLGVRNHWLAIRIRGATVGVAYLQALDGNHGRPSARKNHDRIRIKVLDHVKFARAARLLQFIIRHVQASSLAELSEAELASAGHVVLALEKEQARLHEVLKLHLPFSPSTLHRPEPRSHSEQLVQQLLARMESDYWKPITLQQCAGKLKTNAAYLSNLFSSTVGKPFKTCLTELRIAKAKVLLGDPAKSVSDVAAAVGYASGNRFRIAFKKATGLSPKLWRETMQTTPATA